VHLANFKFKFDISDVSGFVAFMSKTWEAASGV
jgi:hypothetical protein